MRKVIQVQTNTLGDNINHEQKMITTVLYDDGTVYEGYMQKVDESIGGATGCHRVSKYEMVWSKLNLPKEDGGYTC